MLELMILLAALLSPWQEKPVLPLREEWLAPGLDDSPVEIRRYESTWARPSGALRFETILLVAPVRVGRFSRVEVQGESPHEPVLEGAKLSLLQSIPGESFPEHHAVTVLVMRDEPFVLIKESVSVQGVAGITFQQINHLGQIWRYWWDSRWQGEGHGKRLLSVQPLTEQQLLLALRAVAWQESLEWTVPLVWGLHANRASASEPLPSRIRCTGSETVTVPAGRFVCWCVEVTAAADERGTRRSVYYVEKEPPHRLIEHRRNDGLILRLTSS